MHAFPRFQLYCRTQQTLSVKHFNLTPPAPGIPPPAIQALSLLPPTSTVPPSLTTAGQGSLNASLAASFSLVTSPSTGVVQPHLSAESQPFHLASSFAPIPAKLVKRIQDLAYIDLRELLPDNLVLTEKFNALPSHATHHKTPEHREITNIVTWVSCFSTYVAIVAQTHPQRVRDMMAYMRLIVREAHKHGGSGWLQYDCIFRKNNQGPAASWDVLDPSLLTIVANQGCSPRLPCHHCQEFDHSPHECALAPLEQPTRSQLQGRAASYTRSGKRLSPYDTMRYSRFQDTSSTSLAPSSGLSSQQRVCISWNKGQCAFLGACNYAHVCPTCADGSHRARDCPKTPANSFFKRPPQLKQ